MYGNSNLEFNFSSDWLEWFKARHEIKYYGRFGESGSVTIENIETVLLSIKTKLYQFQWNDIYNMDETSLFHCLEIDHSLAKN